MLRRLLAFALVQLCIVFSSGIQRAQEEGKAVPLLLFESETS